MNRFEQAILLFYLGNFQKNYIDAFGRKLKAGNRMTALTDANATGSDAGQKAFSYDAGGNMTSDGRKGLDLS